MFQAMATWILDHLGYWTSITFLGANLKRHNSRKNDGQSSYFQYSYFHLNWLFDCSPLLPLFTFVKKRQVWTWSKRRLKWFRNENLRLQRTRRKIRNQNKVILTLCHLANFWASQVFWQRSCRKHGRCRGTTICLCSDRLIGHSRKFGSIIRSNCNC